MNHLDFITNSVVYIANTTTLFPEIFEMITSDRNGSLKVLKALRSYGLNLLKLALYPFILIAIGLVFAILFRVSPYKSHLKRKVRPFARILLLIVLSGTILCAVFEMVYNLKSKNWLTENFATLENIKEDFVKVFKDSLIFKNRFKTELSKILFKSVFLILILCFYKSYAI